MTNRRHFLKSAAGLSAYGLMGSTGLLSGIGSALAADTSDYKALVCVFMPGGQDHYDTILPFDQSSYDSFSTLRAGLFANYAGQVGGNSRAKERLLKLNPTNSAQYGSREFGLPSEMSALKSLFDQGNAAIVGNVGPLIQPVTRAQLESANPPPIPKSLNSHNDQKSTWLSLLPEGARYGWGGRFLDIMNQAGANSKHTFAAINANFNNVFLSGQSTNQFVLSELGTPTEVDGLDQGFLLDGASVEANQKLENMYRNAGQVSSSLIQQDLAALNNRSFQLNQEYREAQASQTPITTIFPDNYFSRQLKNVANTIKMRSQLGVGRQIFFVEMENFDTHSAQVGMLPSLQQMYSDAISAFFKATEEINVQNDVTLFTASDFGRTLGANGDGTDHGWGGHHFVVGGAVDGNKIHGNLPEATFESEFYTDSHGAMFPQYSVEQYAATLGKWFGLTDAELLTAMPTLSAFNEHDLGFMS